MGETTAAPAALDGDHGATAASSGAGAGSGAQAQAERPAEDDRKDGDDAGLEGLHELEETQGFLQDDEEDGDKDFHSTGLHRPPYGHRVRSQSVSSLAFAFDVLPIPISRDRLDPAEQDREVKHLNLSAGIALVVGMQIGSGIFSSPGVLTADCGSVGMSLLVWVGGGLLAWTGASSFAELGSAIPLNGGPQAYLRYAYGPTLSYLFSWTAVTALKPVSAAVISLIFGEYLCRIMYHTAFAASSEESAQNIPKLVIKLVAVSAILVIGALNAVSLKVGTSAQIALTTAKLLALLAVAVMGLVQLGLGRHSDSLKGNIFDGSTTSPGRYALALYSGLWAYDGWDQCCFVAGEMKNVTRDLPRVIHISMTTMVILYVTANVSYFLVLPKNIVAHSNTVALDFGKEMFGAVGGVVFAAIVALSCFGALNSHIFTSARLIFMSAKEGFLPKYFARLHPTRKTPINAMILQTALTIVMIAFGDFRSLVSFFGFCGWFWYGLTVLGLLVLRSREPNLPRPYKTYLITPITFCCVALFLIFMPIFSAPLETLMACIFISAGYPVYLFTQVQPRRRTIIGVGQDDMGPPPTRVELLVGYVRDIPRRMRDVLTKEKTVDRGGQYEAVELDEDGGTRKSTEGIGHKPETSQT